MALPFDARRALGPALWFAKRLRRFADADARNRDLHLNHSLVTGLRDVRAELSSLGVEQDASAQQVESLSLTIAQLEQELQRLRGTLASLPIAMLAARARNDDRPTSIATSYAVQALAGLPQGASVLDAGDDPHQVAWSLATLGYSVTALGVSAAVPRAGVELFPDSLADWEPAGRRFEGIVTLQGLTTPVVAGAPRATATHLDRLRRLAKPEAVLVLSMPVERLSASKLDERKLRERLPGWTIDDCTIAEQRPRASKGATKASRRIALVTARAS